MEREKVSKYSVHNKLRCIDFFPCFLSFADIAICLRFEYRVGLEDNQCHPAAILFFSNELRGR